MLKKTDGELKIRIDGKVVSRDELKEKFGKNVGEKIIEGLEKDVDEGANGSIMLTGFGLITTEKEKGGEK